MTLSKLQVAVGDGAAALAYARYPLAEGDAPRRFAADPDSDAARRANAIWVGSEVALERVGLGGERGREADAERLALVLEGRHAVTGDRVRRYGMRKVLDADGEVVRDADGKEVTEPVVNSFDLTFGVPKSVSVLWAAADAELRLRIEEAVLSSAVEAVEHVVRTRPVIGGRDSRPAQGFAGMAALQVTARTARGEAVPSPHLHVHVDVFGVVDEAGELKTPASEALYKHSAMREAGAFGRARLARRMTRMGFGVESGTGGGRYWELRGVVKALIDSMSGRTRRDIAAWRAELEAENGAPLTNRDAARGGRVTRASKSEVSAEETSAYWQARFAEHGFDVAAAERAGRAAAAGVAPTDEQLRAEVRAGVLRRIWAEGPTVSLGEVRSIALELATIGLEPGDALAVLDEMQAAGELVALDGWRVTAAGIRRRETFVRDVAVETAGRGDRALSKRAVKAGIASAEAAIGPGAKLYPDQLDAVRKLTSGTGWGVLTGRAGAGKGPVLRAVADAHRREGFKVVGLALDGANAGLLGVQIGERARTVQQLLAGIEHGAISVDDRTLLLIDEASKIGLRDWTALAEIVRASGARLLAVGDIGQIGAIEAPGMLDVMIAEKRIRTATLTTVRRHRDPLDQDKDHPWIGKEYLDRLYEGDAAGAIATLRREGAITMLDSREEAMRALVDRWAERRSAHGIDVDDAVMVVYGPNEDVDKANFLAQWRRLRAGEIGGPGVLAADREYSIHAGDVVMMREAPYEVEQDGRRQQRVENGTRGVVESVDADAGTVTVRFAQPDKSTRLVEVDLAGLRRAVEAGAERVPSLRLAYAGHPFPLQGATFSYVGSLWGHWSQRKEETYSGDARAKLYLDVFVDRVGAGLAGNDNARFKRLADRLARPWHRLASITYGETPDVKIGSGAAVAEASYELPLRERAARDLGERGAGDDVPAGEELLRRFELRLPPTVLDAIRGDAAELERRARAIDSPALHRAIEDARRAVAGFDGELALEVERNRRRRDLLGTRIAETREAVAHLDGEVARAGGDIDRAERWEVLQEIAASNRALADDVAELRELEARDAEVRAGDGHPAGWVAEHRQTLARAVAARTVLAQRGEIDQPRAAEAGRGPEPAQGTGVGV
ncbi:MAG: AAA family ATPase [Solirubrobacterales bacterium]|nr:AAA family ATPase [Solirubrobacterales bacterium]